MDIIGRKLPLGGDDDLLSDSSSVVEVEGGADDSTRQQSSTQDQQQQQEARAGEGTAGDSGIAPEQMVRDECRSAKQEGCRSASRP